MSDDTAAPDPGHPIPVPGAAVVLLSQDFAASSVTALRHRLHAAVNAAGLTGDTGDDFVLAVHELVANAVRHGGGHGRLDLRCDGDVLICEISDNGTPTGTLPVRPAAVDVAGGRGLWLAHQLTEGLILTQGPDGVTATVTACLSPATRPDAPSNGRPDGPQTSAAVN